MTFCHHNHQHCHHYHQYCHHHCHQILVDATSHRGRLLTYLLPVTLVAVLLNIPKVPITITEITIIITIIMITILPLSLITITKSPSPKSQNHDHQFVSCHFCCCSAQYFKDFSHCLTYCQRYFALFVLSSWRLK